MRILVVEDEAGVSDFVQQGLTEAGYAVDVARDGLDGLEHALGFEYDVIVLDLMLPRMSGLDVLRELRNRKVKTPVLLLTARDELDDRVQGLDAGADDYLVKPFAFPELLARALASLTSAIERQNPEATRDAAFDVAIATLDLQLPYRSRVEVDLDRFDLWARRAIADSAAANAGHVAGDVTVLEFIWQRVGHSVDASTAQAMDAQLAGLRAAADGEDLKAAAETAGKLLDLLVGLEPAN